MISSFREKETERRTREILQKENKDQLRITKKEQRQNRAQSLSPPKTAIDWQLTGSYLMG